MSLNKHLFKTIILSIFSGMVVFLLYLLVIIFIGIPSIKSDFLNIVFIGPLKEELLKFFVIIFLVKKFTSPKITAVSVGFGFGLGEQLFHLYNGDPVLWYVILMHTATGLILGIFLQKNSRWKGLLGSTSLHAIYNLGLWLYMIFFLI